MAGVPAVGATWCTFVYCTSHGHVLANHLQPFESEASNFRTPVKSGRSDKEDEENPSPHADLGLKLAGHRSFSFPTLRNNRRVDFTFPYSTSVYFLNMFCLGASLVSKGHEF